MTFFNGFEKSERRSNIEVFVILLLLAVFLRLPFFFKYSFNWDENTFILMGQSLLNGNLPYIELWDNKPPLAFAPFAFFIWLFGKSIVGIRIGATIFVAVTSFFTFLIGKHIWGKQVGLLTAVLCVFFYTWGFGSLNLVIEIIASVPLMAALALGVMRESTPQTSFFVGLLISLTAMIAMNIAYLSIFMGLYILVQTILNKGSITRHLSMYVLGGMVPIGLTILPYAINGHSQILYNSIITAPLQYVSAHGSALESLLILLSKGSRNNNALLWIGSLGGVGVSLMNWKSYTRSQKQGLVLIITFFLGTVFSVINSGGSFRHYLIHLIAFMALSAGYFYSFLSRHVSRFATTFLLLFCLINSATVWEPTDRNLFGEYVNIAQKLKNHQSLSHGTGYELAQYLRKENPSREAVYLMNFHIAYWLTDTKPLSKFSTHPSNITKEYLLKAIEGPQATTVSEVARILDKNPRFIVKKMKRSLLRHKPEAKKLFEKILQNDYSLVKVIQSAHVYKRNDASD